MKHKPFRLAYGVFCLMASFLSFVEMDAVIAQEIPFDISIEKVNASTSDAVQIHFTNRLTHAVVIDAKALMEPDIFVTKPGALQENGTYNTMHSNVLRGYSARESLPEILKDSSRVITVPPNSTIDISTDFKPLLGGIPNSIIGIGTKVKFGFETFLLLVDGHIPNAQLLNTKIFSKSIELDASHNRQN